MSASKSEPNVQIFLHSLDRVVLLLGLLLLGVYLGERLHAIVSSRIAPWQFSQTSVRTPSSSSTPARDNLLDGRPVDVSLWPNARERAYELSLALKIAPPIAVLQIPNVHLIAPVFDGTDDMDPNRDVGRIGHRYAPRGG